MPTRTIMRDASTGSDAARAHLDATTAAAYLDGGLAEDERDDVIAHLASCAECRREVIDVRAALSREPALKAPRGSWRAVAAAVAAVVAIVILPRVLPRGHDAANTFRDPVPTRAAAPGAPDEVSRIAVVAPEDGATVSGGGTPLVWQPAGTGATYLVTVQDTSGAITWSTTTSDTAVVLPRTVPLGLGRRYYWTVDARLADGGAGKSGVRSMVVR